MFIKDEDKTLIMMINDVHRLFRHRTGSIAELNGVSQAVNSILFHLSRNESLTQIDLVNMSHLRSSSISVTLQKMEHDGLIKRESSLTDQRYITVSLTDKGKELEKKIRKCIFDYDESLTANISDEEKAVTKKVILKIIEQLQENK